MLKIILLFFLSLSTFSSERIISTVPSLSEILFELKLVDDVVGVSKYCSFNDEFCNKENVGTSLDFSYEKILKLRPSVVLLSSTTSKSQVNNLKKLKVEVLLLKHDRLQDIYESIKILGLKFKKIKQAELLTKKIKDRFLGLNLEKNKVLFVISSQVKDGRIIKAQVAGSYNFYTDILDKINVENILKTNGLSFPEVGREKLLSLSYDYIIEIFGNHNLKTANTKSIAWRELQKKKKDAFQYIPLNGDFLFVPGPRVWKIVDILKAKLGEK